MFAPRFDYMAGKMPASFKWYAIYADEPQTTVEVDEPGDLLARFDIATMLGHVNRRKVKGMWIISHATEQDDVIRIYGAVPMPISARYYAAKRRHQ